MEKIEKAISDLELYLKNNKLTSRDLLVVIEEQERQLNTLKIIRDEGNI